MKTYNSFGIMTGSYRDYQYWIHQNLYFLHSSFYLDSREKIRGMDRDTTLVLLIGDNFSFELMDAVESYGYRIIQI